MLSEILYAEIYLNCEWISLFLAKILDITLVPRSSNTVKPSSRSTNTLVPGKTEMTGTLVTTKLRWLLLRSSISHWVTHPSYSCNHKDSRDFKNNIIIKQYIYTRNPSKQSKYIVIIKVRLNFRFSKIDYNSTASRRSWDCTNTIIVTVLLRSHAGVQVIVEV